MTPGIPAPTIVITNGWSLGTPSGVARHLQELARHLGMAGAKVIVVCVETAGYSRFPRPPLPEAFRGREIEKELAEVGVEVVRVPPHPLHWTLDGRPIRRAVARILATRKVDAVLGFFNEAAHLPELCATHEVRFGVIATWLSYRMAFSPERTGRGWRGWLNRRSNERFVARPYRRADVIFANSEFTRRELIEILGCEAARIRVTSLGVSPIFGEIPRERPERISRFLFFGRLVPEKGIIDALEALAIVSRKGMRDWTFTILGSGNEAHVRGVAESLGIADLVEFPGHVGDEELRDELRRAHVALLPSHSESFGLSIAESNAAGLPVIAFHAGSVPEVVEDGVTAWLAPFRDVEALAKCIETSIGDPEMTWRAGLAGRERILSTFRWERTAELVIEG
jgi:glycogen synthase